MYRNTHMAPCYRIWRPYSFTTHGGFDVSKCVAPPLHSLVTMNGFLGLFLGICKLVKVVLKPDNSQIISPRYSNEFISSIFFVASVKFHHFWQRNIVGWNFSFRILNILNFSFRRSKLSTFSYEMFIVHTILCLLFIPINGFEFCLCIIGTPFIILNFA